MKISFEHPEPANYTSIGSIQLEKVLAKKPSLSLQTEEELSAMTEIARSVATKLGHFDEFDESESSDEPRAFKNQIEKILYLVSKALKSH